MQYSRGFTQLFALFPVYAVNTKKKTTMKTMTWKLWMMLLALVPAFVACDDDDDNYYYVDNGGTWTTYGNLEKIDNGSRQNYAIRIDDGDRLIVSDGLRFTADAEDEGMRVFLRYAYLGSDWSDTGLNSPMDYYIYLYDIDEVLCKQPVAQTFILENEEHRTDSIGNDPINVQKAWIASKYLNVEFEVPFKTGSSVRHFINLVYDDVTLHNDTMYVYLRHNAYEDAVDLTEGRRPAGEYHWGYGRVSFDLTPILPDGQESVPVKFIWTEFNREMTGTQEKSDGGTFTLNAAAGEENDARNGLQHQAVQQATSQEVTMMQLK